MEVPTLHYRKEIDGLRAIAVLPVIFFHAGFEVFSGGFVGVDIFFVISGFLITSILINELEQNHFSILRFYERRARRILPALFTVLLASTLFAWMWMTPWEMKLFAESLIATLFFASNIYFWQMSGYFDTAAEVKPLLHTWSLAVEEQYYLVFPLFLLLFWHFGRRRVFWVVISVAAVSLLLSEYGSRNFPNANFYLAPSRTWELLIGSICAFVTFFKTQKANNVLSLIGFFLIAFSIFSYDSSTPFPSIYALAPVLGSAMILLYAGTGTLLGRVLSSAPFVGFGLISYSLYLWHQPIFAFARLRAERELDLSDRLTCIVASVVLSFFCWYLIEQPFRRKDKIGFLGIIMTSCTGAAVLISLGAWIQKLEGLPERYAGINQTLTGYDMNNDRLKFSSLDKLRKLVGNPKYYGATNNAAEPVFSANDKLKILIVGNSHSKDVYNMFAENTSLYGNYDFSRFGIKLNELDHTDKNGFFKSQQYSQSQVIMVSTRYALKSDYNDFDGLRYLVRRANADGKLIIITSNTVEFNQSGNLTLADRIIIDLYRKGNIEKFEPQFINSKYFSEKKMEIENINLELQKIASELGVPYLAKEEYMCEKTQKLCYSISENGSKYFYDYGHYTVSGAEFFGKRAAEINWLDRGLNSALKKYSPLRSVAF